jgi:alanine-synthesizing transaminase
VFSSRTNWPNQINRYTEALEAARQAPRELLDLTLSNPTLAGFDFDEGAILAAMSQSAALEYHPEAKGLRSAREAIAEYYRNE